MPEFARRIGSTPQERGSLTNATCPDIFEMTDGSYAVIGTDATNELAGKLPVDLPPGARILLITRETLGHAKRDIPDA